ncbi:MAG TPA: hypothetical protein VGM23_02090, partial [Armatimonadota bacterium]
MYITEQAFAQELTLRRLTDNLLKGDELKGSQIISFVVLCCTLCCVPTISFGQGQTGPSLAIRCDEYAKTIKTAVVAGDFRHAILAAADYERFLGGQYPPPSYEQGVFTFVAFHTKFTFPEEGWTANDISQDTQLMETINTFRATGLEMPLLLQGQKDKRFALVFYDMDRLEQRLQFKFEKGAEITDQCLLDQTKKLASGMGTITTYSFKTIGNLRTLTMEVTQNNDEKHATIYTVANGHLLSSFVLYTNGSRQERDQLLTSLIQRTDFRFMPADEAMIAAARKKVVDTNDIGLHLTCIRELALAGEYGAAMNEISRTRAAIGSRLIKPFIEGNIARFPAYGAILQNPDPQRWKLSIQEQGTVDALLLEDRASVNDAGVAIMFFDTILLFGPELAKVLGPDSNDEALRKLMMKGAGRGGLQSMGGTIETESFRFYKD